MSDDSNKPDEKWWQAEDLQWMWRRFKPRLFVLAVGLVVGLFVIIQEWFAGIR
jgi:hypothetical protein